LNGRTGLERGPHLIAVATLRRNLGQRLTTP
jgi:hypothetical protein